MATASNDNPVARATGGLYSTWGQLAANVGVPFTLAIIILFQLAPAIQHGIEIADRVDGELQILAANCSALQQRPTTVVVTPPQQP